MTYRLLFDRVLSRMDPEDAHHRAVTAIRAAGRTPVLRAAVRAATAAPSSPCTVMGLTFPHPFGLAAGFDKDARMVPGLLALGFGHVEIGTVTGRPQPGNPRPRLFRLVDDRAVVNRMGFNNDGAEVVARRLAALRDHGPVRDAVVGVNIGKTKVVPAEEAAADYVRSTRLLAPHASYLVVNVSSPNTPGLRDLQATEALRPLLGAVRDATGDVRDRHLPLLVKVAPDLADDDLDAVADLAVELGLDGVVATNTTIARPASLRTSRATVAAAGAGGLSGPVLADRSAEVLRRLRARVGERLALVSVGGVVTADDARARLDAGADLVQGYTAFVYEGPLWAARIARGLARR